MMILMSDDFLVFDKIVIIMFNVHKTSFIILYKDEFVLINRFRKPKLFPFIFRIEINH